MASGVSVAAWLWTPPARVAAGVLPVPAPRFGRLAKVVVSGLGSEGIVAGVPGGLQALVRSARPTLTIVTAVAARTPWIMLAAFLLQANPC
jgi:hypothetical protein